MAINIKFDLANNPEPPTIILARRNGDKLGQLDAKEIELNDKFNDASEMSFTLYKYTDGELTNLWDKVVDFRLIYCKEWDMWFEIKVELDEETETIKTVFCTQLGQAELSQLMLYDIHINEEGDSNWDTDNKEYKSTILYDPKDTSASLLHRLLKDKAPHYSILYVDDTIANIQRTFSFDGTSIYDAFMEIAEEIGCLFVFHSNSDKDGKIQRTISVYDLQQNCLNPDCEHRGEFTDVCPKCGGKNENGEQFGIKYGHGVDTTIFVTSDELAAEGIQLTTDTDSVKNCFKLEAGDDLMTATIRNCNPNGTDYIWYFSDDMKSDMSEELVDALESYDAKYKDIRNNHVSNVDMGAYNSLVEKYKDRYNASSTHCLNCSHKGNFTDVCPECGSNSILVGDRLESIESPIIGYPALMKAYYNVIDLALYLESGLMPTVDISDDLKAEDYATMLTSDALSPVAVNVTKAESISETTADSAVLSMAKIIVKSTYKVEILSSSLSDEKKWSGTFKITNYSDDTDNAEVTVTDIEVNNDTETFIKQKIEKALIKEDADDLSISGLFAKEYDEFCEDLKNYALNPLKSFYDACEACLTILQDQGVGDKESWSDNTEGSDGNLYEKLYLPYYEKQQAIAEEIVIRENEVNSVDGVWDETDKDNKVLVTKGIQQYIEECRNEIQELLDFQKHLETYSDTDNLWLEFCAYRREDTYSNDNYTSDGLNNAELFKRASEFVEVAENEIFKSAELQHSISTSLKNLLAIPKFKPLVEYFSVGNWIRVRVDEQVYKLRLLEYNISFDSFDTISVDFSDVIKIKSGITDIQEVLSQASSMATSYSSVQKQASQGEKSNAVLNSWVEEGLNATNTKIVGTDNQNQIWDKNGILCREYDPITDTYSDEQLKIINSTIAITDNNWESTKTAIGKYFYTDPLTGELKSAYGVNGETIVGKLLIGEDLIISNDNGRLEFNNEGLVASNGINTVSINPNSDYSVFNIKKQNDNIFSFDDDGNLVIIGNITANKLTLLDDAEVNAGHIKGLADVALSGEYSDLSGTPTKLSDFENDKAFITNDTSDLANYYKKSEIDNSLDLKANKDDLSNVATSGLYNDLLNAPILSTVATTGSYNDLVDIDELKNWVNEQIQNAISS